MHAQKHFLQSRQVVNPLDSRGCAGIRGAKGGIALQPKHPFRFGDGPFRPPLFQNRLIRRGLFHGQYSPE
jgi:hypothetical protein